MNNALTSWFNGYILVSVDKDKAIRFINLCNNRKIKINCIENDNTNFYLSLAAADYKKLKPVTQKVKAVPSIVKKTGLPFILFRYRKRQAFLLGFFICIFIMYISSLFIWDVSIYGQNRHTSEALTQYLKKIDIYEGVLIRKVSCKSIEDSIRKEYSDIGWVSAQIVGTRLKIRIEENSVIIDEGEKKSDGHLSTEYDGTIVSVLVRNGKSLVTPGMTVKAGDILVSGVVEIIGDDGTCVGKTRCLADADIFIKRTILYEDSQKFIYTEKKYTGKSKKEVAFLLKRSKIKLIRPLKSFDKCDIIVDVYDTCLFDNFVLPIELQVSNYRQYNEVDKKYSKDEIFGILNERFERYCDKLISEGAVVNNKNTECKYSSKSALLKGIITVTDKAEGYCAISNDDMMFENIEEKQE